MLTEHDYPYRIDIPMDGIHRVAEIVDWCQAAMPIGSWAFLGRTVDGVDVLGFYFRNEADAARLRQQWPDATSKRKSPV
jgi:hypothetical protein